MFLHLSVSHSVHRRGDLHAGGLHLGGSALRGGSASRGVCIQRGWADPHHWILWDAVNEWLVCLLLECILITEWLFIPDCVTDNL